MLREIEWKETLEDGSKRKVRVKIFGGKIKWQFHRDGVWDYDSPPAKADWEELIRLVENRHQRRRAPLKDLELVRESARLATREMA